MADILEGRRPRSCSIHCELCGSTRIQQHVLRSPYKHEQANGRANDRHAAADGVFGHCTCHTASPAAATAREATTTSHHTTVCGPDTHTNLSCDWPAPSTMTCSPTATTMATTVPATVQSVVVPAGIFSPSTEQEEQKW